MANRNSNGGLFQPKTLEVDNSLFDKNLRIVESGFSDTNPAVSPFLNQNEPKSILPEPDLPSITVIPDSGMCVKTKNIEGEKVFINVCKVQSIPPAKPISEEALQNIIASEDYTSDFRIPMSLGAPRKEKDKSGRDCYSCDVAVNSVWYDQTMVDSLTFTTFLVTLAMEGLCNKYGDVCNLDRQNWSILRNKKYMGKPQKHTIQQRANFSKIQEVSGNGDELMKPIVTSKPLISTVKEKPDLLLVKNPPDSTKPEMMNATLKLPKVVSVNELVLELGEDRFVLQSENYFLDIFLPFNISHDKSKAVFLRDRHELKVDMKVVP